MHKEACPKCRANGSDKSGDNLAVYDDGGKFCFACGYCVLSPAEKERRGIDKWEWDEEEDEVMSKETLTREEINQIKEYTGERGCGLRGITDETYAAYLVRHKYDEETGDPIEQFYPVTEGGKASGYKIRTLPKDFHGIGRTGKDCDLFGQWKWKNISGRSVVICAGEVDTLSAYQMLEDYRKSKGYDTDTPCVSSTIGESGSDKQIAKHYDWFERFDKIIVCYDIDKAGQDAVEKLANVLPKGKMFVMHLPMKDTNLMLTEGKARQWIDCYYKASPYTPTGVVGSSQLYDEILKEAHVMKLPFPPFMKKANEMMAGGVSLGTIGTISASTGQGKSVIVNECVYHWIFNTPHKIGVVSMEQNKGQYGELMLSRHIKVKLGRLTQEEKIKVLEHPDTVEAQQELFYNEDGTDRWMVVDDRDGDVDSLKAAIEKLIISCDCKAIVIDTISDMFDGLSTDEQAVLMKWQKSIVNRYNVAIINISHQRKASNGEKDGGQGAMGNESSLHGTSTLTKSSAWIMMMARNKTAEDPIERNTTQLMIPKNRGAGETGPAGSIYYDNIHHVLYDLDEWLASQEVEF